MKNSANAISQEVFQLMLGTRLLNEASEADKTILFDKFLNQIVSVEFQIQSLVTDLGIL
jgi:hypothetical protein